MSKKENIVSFYYMPRDLAHYGEQFAVEYVPASGGLDAYYNTFIKLPDWCRDFDSMYPGKHKHIIRNFKIKDIKFASMDGIIAYGAGTPHFDEYSDLEKRLGAIGIEQEIASTEGRWHKYMDDNVLPLKKDEDVTESN